MENISDNEIMNAFNLIIPYLHLFFDNEAAIAITDTEKYLSSVGSTGLTLKNLPGDPLPENGLVLKAFAEGHALTNYLPAEVFGVAIKSCAVPIRGKNGKHEGCLVVAKSQKKRDELLELSRNLSATFNEVSEVFNEFSAKLETVVQMNIETSNLIDEARENANRTDKIFGYINQVSSQTDLLGINAAIEATRTGAEGKGFKVIAQEIRKLSDSSRDSVNKIYDMLGAINKSVDDVYKTISKSQTITASYSEAFSDIVVSVKRLNENSKNLEAIADKI